MSSDAYVIAHLARLKDEADAEVIVDYDRVVKQLDTLCIPTLADYWKNGRLKDPETELTPAEKAALKRWKVRRVQNRRAGVDQDWEVEDYIIEIELWNKVKIIVDKWR